jgi:hypothetical protein
MAEPKKRAKLRPTKGRRAKAKSDVAKPKPEAVDPIDALVGLGGLLVGGVGFVTKLARESERARCRAIVEDVLDDGEQRRQILDLIDADKRPDPFKFPAVPRLPKEDPKCRT